MGSLNDWLYNVMIFFHSPYFHHSLFLIVEALKYLFATQQENSTRLVKMASYLWRKYADHLWTKWQKTLLWDMVEQYRRPKTFTPLVMVYVPAFYTGVIGAAITEQLYKVQFY